MIRSAGWAAVLLTAIAAEPLVAGVEPRQPLVRPTTLAQPVPESRMHGRMVILSDGLLIGYVTSVRRLPAGRLEIDVSIDPSSGLGPGAMTLTVPTPAGDDLPIRLGVSQTRLSEILAPALP